jgi:hypothetical protein
MLPARPPATPPGGLPVILFGAFDRHNFGDLLLAHVAAALLRGRELHFAGLATRDLRPFGGHAVTALAELAAGWGGRPAALLQVGGEVLSCTAWQAAVMLQPGAELQPLIRHLEARPAERQAWVRRTIGYDAQAPYLAPRALFRGPLRWIGTGLGGVELQHCARSLRAEVLATLAAADDLSVRDAATQAQLQAAGIAARLVPDPAVMVAALFGARIRGHARRGEVARLRAAFPQGWIAAQCSADFGDDSTLDALAAQLEDAAVRAGSAVVLWRAGAAPWHDDAEVLARLAARLRRAPVHRFASLRLWDLCALLASARAFAGSSLHGRIVATAFARPRVSLRLPGSGKVEAWAGTWEAPGLPTSVGVDGLAEALRQALAVDPARLRRHARALARQYRADFALTRAAVAAPP